MKPKKPILLYCADRELLSTTAFALQLQPYEVIAVHDTRSAAAVMMAGGFELVCGVLIHAKQGDLAGRLIHRLLDLDLHIPLLLVDRDGDLAPVRYVDMLLYGRKTSMSHILGALSVLCAQKRGPRGVA
jgi:hypothetical protein